MKTATTLELVSAVSMKALGMRDRGRIYVRGGLEGAAVKQP